MSDKRQMIFQILHDSQEKYTYYILGITLAALGFIIANSTTIIIETRSIPLGSSIAMLSISFILGIRNIEYKNSILYSNYDLLLIESGEHPEIGQSKELMIAAAEGIKIALVKNINRAQLLGRWQNYLMLLGMLSYFGYKIVKVIP